MLEIIHSKGLPLDCIVTVDVWATSTISADLPSVEAFKKYADKEILKRYGMQVLHIKSDRSYEEQFYAKFQTGKRKGEIYGFPYRQGPWCNNRLKIRAMKHFQHKQGNPLVYIGYAINEKSAARQKRINEYLSQNCYGKIRYPLCDYGITEEQAFDWCRNQKLLSPSYDITNRGGCWFCHNQKNTELEFLMKQYPQYMELLLKWDQDSPHSFHPDGKTVHKIVEEIQEKRKQLSFL